MASYPYWFLLRDFSESPFPQAFPRVWVEGREGVFGKDGPIAPRRVPVMITEGGACLVYLVASVDTSPPVEYTLNCDWISLNLDGVEVVAGHGEWRFTALAGGGDIADMVSAPPSVIWFGPPWPSPIRPGVYWDTTTDDIGRVGP